MALLLKRGSDLNLLLNSLIVSQLTIMDKSHLKCKFCNENFDTDLRSPKMLYACGHSICSSCLREFLNTREHFNCVEDNAKISLTDAKFESFPPNIVLLNMLRDSQKNVFHGHYISPQVMQPDKFSSTVKKKQQSLRKEYSERKLVNTDDLSVISDNRTVSHNYRKDSRREMGDAMNLNDRSLYAHNVGSEDSFGYDNQEEGDICEAHGKRLEAVCEEDCCQMRVCLECGLFGAHVVRLLGPFREKRGRVLAASRKPVDQYVQGAGRSDQVRGEYDQQGLQEKAVPSHQNEKERNGKGAQAFLRCLLIRKSSLVLSERRRMRSKPANSAFRSLTSVLRTTILEPSPSSPT